MATLTHSWHTTRTREGWALYRVLMPFLAGGCMLGASISPWLIDPLGQAFPAWELPVDIGWQLHASLFSYGLLCLCCALYAFSIAYLAWRDTNLPVGARPCNRPRGWAQRFGFPRRSQRAHHVHNYRAHYTLAGLLCLIPIGLFFTQYLFIDMGSIAQLAQHEFQALFIQNHFGYHVAAQFIPIRLDTFDPSTLNGRFTLLLDQIQPGLYLPFLATLCLFSSRHMVPVMQQEARPPKRGWTGKVPIIVCFSLLLVVLGRGPAALASRFEAEHLLTTGDYASALTWLDRASMLNPSLEQLPAYHIERGQAWYYLHPTQPTIESQAYLAAFYRTQQDYLSAYQQLIAAYQRSVETPAPSWLVDELSITLTKLAEMPKPLSGAPATLAKKDLPSIPWLNTLSHINPNNVYAHYTLGRIAYDTHDFTACEKQMLSVMALSSEPNILSSVYTYLSLSSEAEGNYVKARDYLFTAQAYDPSYRNSTAREEMSGLH